MATPRGKHVFKEPVMPQFPSLDPVQLAPWIDAVCDYAQALNEMKWFISPADDRQGRLILEEIPNSSPELKQAKEAISNLFVSQDSKIPYLLEAFESCILLSFPNWEKTLRYLKKEHKFTGLKKKSPPTFEDTDYLYHGRHIVDTFCDPIKQSEKWKLFLKELSLNIREQLSNEIPDKELNLLVQQQTSALEAIFLNAAAYCLLIKWSALYVPKEEMGTDEAHISREKQRILNVLVSPLTSAFNDKETFLETLFKDYTKKKKSIPLLALRIAVSIEIDERLLKYVHKTEDLPNIQRLKTEVKEELEGRLKEKREDAAALDEEAEQRSAAIAVTSPRTDRPRTKSTPAKLMMVDPAALMNQSVLFQRRRESDPDKSKETKTLASPPAPM